MDLYTKNRRKKNQEQKNGPLNKKVRFYQKINRQIVLMFYPSYLNQGSKDVIALIFRRNL